mgnify:CR=1 FL=1
MREQVLNWLESLEAPGNRLRTGLLLISPAHLARVAEIASYLLATPEDIAQMALKQLPPGARYASLSATSISKWLDEISQKHTGQRRALVVNLDLLLAGISEDERNQVWTFVKDSMPYRPRVVIIAMPEGAKHLLPQVEDWETAGRCMRWSD